jgi:glyoxylase-like metal-dependent hydrolase (beta-lactamase superfamily II)
MLTQEIIPDVYQLTSRGVNMFLIAEKELTLIDTGFYGSSADVVEFIHGLGRSIHEMNLIIITHNHFDHTGGLAELRELTQMLVAAHPAGIIDASKEPPDPGRMQRLLRIPFFFSLSKRFVLKAGDVDIQLNGGEVLKPLGGLEVIHTPGHTADSICLYSPEKKLLFVGDALVRRRKSVLFPHKMVSSNLEQAVDSVKKMAELDCDILCFGHGWPMTEDAHAIVAALAEKGQG